MRKALVLTGLLIPLIFSSGCAGALKGYAKDILDAGTTHFQEKILPAVKEESVAFAKSVAEKAKEEAIAWAEAKLAEREKKVLAELDALLEKVAPKDEDTGTPINPKKALDFDENGDGFLQPGEYSKAMFYVSKKAAASGDWGTAGSAATGGAAGLAILTAAEWARRRRRKTNGDRGNDPPPGEVARGGAPPTSPTTG